MLPQHRSLLLVGAELNDQVTDVRVAAGRVVECASRLRPRRSELVIDARGGALLPGLHDHHLHLLALAAAARSIPCGPPQVLCEADLRRALRERAPSRGWVRGVGYHESVAGHLDRWRLDAWLPDQPLRVQHRSGAFWVLNSRALGELGVDGTLEGAERDAAGRLTGRVYRADAALRDRLPSAPLELAPVGALLARRGVTGVTDAGAANGAAELALLERAVASSELPQRVRVMGRSDLPASSTAARVECGAEKFLLDEWSPPPLDALTQGFAAAHGRGRPVAVHCVARSDLFLALAALEDAGPLPGDRIEHASITPPEAMPRLAALGVTVVTQPGFVRERGDDYQRDVPVEDQPWLYRLRSFDTAGIRLAAGTDAPYGEPDPWLAMRAAVERRTRSGAPFGAEEAITPERALALFTTPLASPGDAPRRVEPGTPADLCLLRAPWREVRMHLDRELVAATLIAGRVVWRAAEVSG